MAISLTVNGTSYQVEVPREMPLLWVIRDVIGLTGTKYGCAASPPAAPEFRCALGVRCMSGLFK